MSVTKEELLKAYEKGYQMFILDACVCSTTNDLYSKFITEAYANRKKIKKEMEVAK
jgi:hypothetical protein